jgi:hypothetical protein
MSTTNLIERPGIDTGLHSHKPMTRAMARPKAVKSEAGTTQIQESGE